jgi:hypothetical protein
MTLKCYEYSPQVNIYLRKLSMKKLSLKKVSLKKLSLKKLSLAVVFQARGLAVVFLGGCLAVVSRSKVGDCPRCLEVVPLNTEEA